MHEGIATIPAADMTRKGLAFPPFALGRGFFTRLRSDWGIFLRPARKGLAVLLLLVFAADPAASAAGTLRAMKNPIPASAFMLRDVDGKLVSLGDFDGKVVLLNFWATWCANCRSEMPAMERLYQSRRADGFEIVAISVDQVSTEKVKAFAEELKLTFSVLHDRDSIISNLYSNPGVPVSYLVDRKGRIVYRVLGEYDWYSPEARDTVQALLGEARKNN
jgi:peroxiredoxin